MSRRWAAAVAAMPMAAVVALSGCSGGSQGDITPAAARLLQDAVQHVREVASTHNYLELQAAVAQLKSLVRQQQRLGHVSASRAAAIFDAADVLLQDESPSPSPTPSPTTTSPTPTPTPTTTSPTPTPTPTPSVTTTIVVSPSTGQGNGNGNGGGNIIPSG